MAPFKAGASIWDLLREKCVSWEIKGQGAARKYFAKKTVAFDVMNMMHAAGRAPGGSEATSTTTWPPRPTGPVEGRRSSVLYIGF